MRQLISSGTIWEKLAGYSRAVRVGPFVSVSGTTATNDDGELVGPNDAYAQTIFIIEKIERALREAGASLDDVTRTRIYLSNADDWEAVSRAHAVFFSERRPANTLIAVGGIIGDGYLVEIEADAIIESAL